MKLSILLVGVATLAQPAAAQFFSQNFGTPSGSNGGQFESNPGTLGFNPAAYGYNGRDGGGNLTSTALTDPADSNGASGVGNVVLTSSPNLVHQFLPGLRRQHDRHRKHVGGQREQHRKLFLHWIRLRVWRERWKHHSFPVCSLDLSGLPGNPSPLISAWMAEALSARLRL